MKIAIVGKRNAGKSTFINALVGSERVIASEVPGTTRDAIRESVSLGGVALTLIDTAGIRETDDPIESEGIRRARAEIASADHVLWVADVRDGIAAGLADARRVVASTSALSLVLNKSDLFDGPIPASDTGTRAFVLSAKTLAGVDALVAHLRALAGDDETRSGAFSARRRHIDALEKASSAIAAAGPLLGDRLELAAEELRSAQQYLDELTGVHSSDDLLGEIFSSFCIGK